jgi:hypothetical protein
MEWVNCDMRLMVVTTNTSVFWSVMLCSLADIHWRFGGTFCFHLQDRRLHIPDYMESHPTRQYLQA